MADIERQTPGCWGHSQCCGGFVAQAAALCLQGLGGACAQPGLHCRRQALEVIQLGSVE